MSGIILTDAAAVEEAPIEGRTGTILLLDSERLKPLPPDLFGEICARCQKPESKWAFLPSDGGPDADPQLICSKCFLYESGWGLNRKEDLARMVGDVEKAMETVFEKDEFGMLIHPKDCDRMLASIAYISRMHELRMAQMAKQAAESSQLIVKPGQPTQSRIPIVGNQFKLIK